jgi:phosphoribosylamine--glycine ligase
MPTLRPAVIGKDGRTTAIEKALRASPRVAEVVVSGDGKNPFSKAAQDEILEKTRRMKPDFVVIGPEGPLAAGLVDRLQEELGIPCVGPVKALAELESSKAFTRNLLAEYGIPGNPEFQIFDRLEGIREYLVRLGSYVVKPDGLTGGKGVKISDAHLFSIDEALAYCAEILSDRREKVVIEEKLEGEEFSLMSFCDGLHVSDMVVVQDHKRLSEGDTGPNTGGMGSYSCEDHGLPFLPADVLEQAKRINRDVAKALLDKTKQKYKGVLYGGFMLTPRGLRLLEYNARFGDPETLNVLSILKTDFATICEAIINEELHRVPIVFEQLATVCKYVVPDGYPEAPKKDVMIDLSNVPRESAKLRIYPAALDLRDGNYFLTGSRAIAFVGIGRNLREAESIAEGAASAVRGPVVHRRDIGTQELVERRVSHVRGFAPLANSSTAAR